uniref:Lipase_3 domain-containing protein n=1 Tax=Caenorhabditis tropicalis TaxID=1561998 RepID=A0A1I7V1S1_9PELO
MTTSFSTLTDVTTQEENYRGGTPLATFYIGPTSERGRYPAICEASLTPVVLFLASFKEATLTIGRFFNKPLPVAFIGKTGTVTDENDDFIPHLNGCRFLHREIRGYHVLARIYKDDVTGKQARQALNNFARDCPPPI